MFEMGRTLIFLGLLIVGIGAVVLLLGRVPGIGKLPGDIFIQRKNFTFYFPIATSLLVSVLLSFFFWLLSKK